MLKIRLQRIGRKNDPSFRVVLTDSKNSAKSGKFLEILGTYNPKSAERNLLAERIKYWIGQGAKCSGTMHNFLVQDKIIEGKKINVLPRKKPTVKRKELKVKK
jgi:small subunit ribosomal protein S16